MFDVRKSQPKLVYSRTSHQESQRREEKKTAAVPASTDRVEKQSLVLQQKQPWTESSQKQQPQHQQTIQQQQQQQIKGAVQQKIDAQLEQSNQPQQVFVRVISTMKSVSMYDTKNAQTENPQTSSKLSPGGSTNEPYRSYTQPVFVLDNQKNITKIENVHVYRSQGYDISSDNNKSLTQKASNNSSLLTGPAVQGTNQLRVPSSPTTRSPGSSPVIGHRSVSSATPERNPSSSPVIGRSSVSSATPERNPSSSPVIGHRSVSSATPERSPASSPAVGRSSTFSSPSAYGTLVKDSRLDNFSNTAPRAGPQIQPQTQQINHQYIRYQQEHQNLLHQQQQIFREHTRQVQDARLHAAAMKMENYPTERQQTSPTANKGGNSEQPWTIPRVNPSLSVRPHSMTLASTRAPDGPGKSQLNPGEFSSYNPSASPRALRSSFRLDSDSSPGQHPSSPISSSSPPKSILKNTLSLEQSDLYLSSRPLMLPRAHSEKSPSNMARAFDFSSILTSNKNPLSTKVHNVKVTGQVRGYTGSPVTQSKRPVTAGAALIKNEPNQEKSQQKKSVTFNSQVQLHLEDQVSTVQGLLVDA